MKNSRPLPFALWRKIALRVTPYTAHTAHIFRIENGEFPKTVVGLGPYKPNMKNTVDLTIDHFPLLALWVNHSIPKQVYGKGWAL